MARTLVVERHDWETSGSGHQLQFPRAAFRRFFRTAGFRTFRIFVPPQRTRPSRVAKGQVAAYAKSGTFRLNRITEIGSMGPGFVLIEEVMDDRSLQPSYDIWWFVGRNADKIAKRRWKWSRAKDSQHGPGRRWTILGRRGPRTI
jgi:hypothetical protein